MSKDKIVRPSFVPDGLDFDKLPQGVQSAVIEILDPAFRELVVCPESALERLTGLTIVHMLWLEIIEQPQLNKRLAKQLKEDRVDRLPSSSDDMLGHLRLLGAKDKACNFLLRLRVFTAKYGTDPLRKSTTRQE